VLCRPITSFSIVVSCPLPGASTLAKDDVDRMVKEAEKFAGEDKKRREAVDTKNQAESLIYQTEKQLKEFEAKVPADIKVRWSGVIRGAPMAGMAAPRVHVSSRGKCACVCFRTSDLGRTSELGGVRPLCAVPWHCALLQ
jgi:hypothetical protein